MSSELLPIVQTISIIVGIATLFGIAIKIGGQAKAIEVTQKQMEREIGELRDMRKELSQVPLLTQRLGFLENSASRLTSYVQELREQRAASEAVKRWSEHDK